MTRRDLFGAVSMLGTLIMGTAALVATFSLAVVAKAWGAAGLALTALVAAYVAQAAYSVALMHGDDYPWLGKIAHAASAAFAGLAAAWTLWRLAA